MGDLERQVVFDVVLGLKRLRTTKLRYKKYGGNEFFCLCFVFFHPGNLEKCFLLDAILIFKK